MYLPGRLFHSFGDDGPGNESHCPGPESNVRSIKCYIRNIESDVYALCSPEVLNPERAGRVVIAAAVGGTKAAGTSKAWS